MDEIESLKSKNEILFNRHEELYKQYRILELRLNLQMAINENASVSSVPINYRDTVWTDRLADAILGNCGHEFLPIPTEPDGVPAVIRLLKKKFLWDAMETIILHAANHARAGREKEDAALREVYDKLKRQLEEVSAGH